MRLDERQDAYRRLLAARKAGDAALRRTRALRDLRSSVAILAAQYADDLPDEATALRGLADELKAKVEAAGSLSGKRAAVRSEVARLKAEGFRMGALVTLLVELGVCEKAGSSIVTVRRCEGRLRSQAFRANSLTRQGS